jgi:hypothetical protein
MRRAAEAVIQALFERHSARLDSKTSEVLSHMWDQILE